MSVQDFENHLRKNLDTHRSELDTEALWNNLAPVLAEDKKRRRGLIWWWTGAGLLALLLIGGWMYFARPDEVLTRPAEKQTSGSLNKIQSPSAASTSANEPQNAITKGTETEVLPSETLIPTSAQATTAPNRKGEPASIALKTKPTGPLKSIAVNRNAAKKTAQTEDNRISEKVSSSDQSGSYLIYNTGPENGVVETSTKNQTGEQDQATVLSSSQNDSKTTQSATEESSNLQVDSPSAIGNIGLLATLSLLVPEKNRMLPTLAPVTLPPATPRKRSNLETLLRADFGMGKPFKTLERQLPDSISAPNRDEKVLEYLSADLLGGIKHHSGFYALAGIGYTRINEEFSLTATRTEYDSIPNGITEIYIDINGDSTFVYGPIEATRHISTRKRTYNSYTLWDIPVIAGFSFEQNRLSLAVEGGVFVNLKLKAEGNILDEYNDVIKIEDANLLKKSIELSYYGSLRFGYAIGDHFQVSLAPSIRIVPSLTKDTYPLAQKYTLMGLNVGARWKF